jgi:hypothetical protein
MPLPLVPSQLCCNFWDWRPRLLLPTPLRTRAAPAPCIQAILFTCVLIAAKVVGQVPHPRILTYMLSKLSDVAVSSLEAYDVGVISRGCRCACP